MPEQRDDLTSKTSGRRTRRPLKVPGPVGLPYRARYRRIWRAQSRGDFGRAHQLAVETERWAAIRGADHIARLMAAMVTEIQPHIIQPLQLRGLEDLEAHSRQAFRSERYGEALTWTEDLLHLPDLDSAARRRALVNRAVILATLGRFAQATAAFDAIVADGEVWQSMQPVTRDTMRLARQAVEAYRVGVSLESIMPATPQLGRNATLWQLYWWLLGHSAWDNARRLESVRRASLRTFSCDWDPTLDRILWGLDLQLGWHESRDYYERRVMDALRDPKTVLVLGRSAWFDIYADWLHVLFAHDDPRAPGLWERHITWCDSHGYDGWVAYWQAHPPARQSS